MSACSPAIQKDAFEETGAFFQNSIRRASLPNEIVANAIVGILKQGTERRNCTGFFVANEENLPLVMSARHCFAYDAAAWCAANGRVKDELTKNVRACKRVVAESRSFDFVLFEFDGEAPTVSLELADFEAPKDTELRMYGYPGDPQASGELMVTENCWVRAHSTVNPYAERFETTEDKNFLHNCSTYGGNSGGPMVLSGSLIALGLPNAYVPQVFRNRSSSEDAGAEGIWMSAFVAKHRAELAQAKVVVKDKAGDLKVVPSARALLSGEYLGEDCLTDWKVKLQAIYNTNSYLAEVKAWWVSGDDLSVVEYECIEGLCRDADGDTTLKIESPNRVTYTGVSGKTCSMNLTAQGRF